MHLWLQVYEEKLAALRAKGNPIKLRYDEAGTRDAAAQSLSNSCQHNLQWAQTEDPKYAHIDAGERETVSKECAAALTWLDEKMRAQSVLSKTDPPAMLTNDILARKKAVESVCNPIINKPVPAPPKEEKKEEPKAPAPAEGEAAQPAAAANAATGEAEPMQEDVPADAAAAASGEQEPRAPAPDITVEEITDDVAPQAMDES